MVAILAGLNASTPPATTYRNRTDAFAKAEFPARALYAASEQVELFGAKTRLRKLKVRLEHIVQAAAPADSQIDPLLVDMAQRMTAGPTWGGLAKATYELQTEWETESSYQDLCIAVTEWEVHYTTLEDPSQPGLQ